MIRLPRSRISRGELARMEAWALNKRIGDTWRAYTGKQNDRALCAMVDDMKAVRCDAGTARGAVERRKGGVIKGGRVWA